MNLTPLEEAAGSGEGFREDLFRRLHFLQGDIFIGGRTMARWLAILTLALSFSMVGLPAAATSIQKHQERLSLARDMANMTLTLITDQQKKPADRMENLKRGFANVVDTGWIAKFVVGAAWRTATEEQRARYMELYQQFLMQTYISTYAEKQDQQVIDIKVVDVKTQDGDNFTTRTEVKLSNAKKLHVDYLVKAEEGSNKIIDVIIEGVSLLSTHRSEFSQMASKGGMSGIIGKLEQLVKMN